MPQKVKKIACVNSAAGAIRFRVHAKNDTDSPYTQEFLVSQYQVLDISTDAGISKGKQVTAEVEFLLGATNKGDEYVEYDPGADAVATYNVVGTSLIFSVTLIQ